MKDSEPDPVSESSLIQEPDPGGSKSALSLQKPSAAGVSSLALKEPKTSESFYF